MDIARALSDGFQGEGMAGVRADMVLRGGPIWCGLQAGRAEAIALWSGRVLATGAGHEIENLIGPETKVVDLRGRTAIPGLNDNHLHLLPYGMGLQNVDVRATEVKTLQELLRRVKERAERTAPGEWVLARGYDQFQLDVGRHPLREELDAVAPENPVMVTRTCGHVAIVNSRALHAAGVNENTPEIPGGYIERKEGRLTGMVAERAMGPFKEAMPKPGEAMLVDAIEAAGQKALSYGITSVMEAALGMIGGMDEWLAYQAAKRAGRLPVRVYHCLYGGDNDTFDQAYAGGMRFGMGDEMMRVGAVKIFTDGSAGGKTAAMFDPYRGDELTRGVLCLSDEAMNDYTMEVHAKGFQLAVHAIGDHAIEQTLVAIEKAYEKYPSEDLRHRIEHCGFATPSQLDRMVKLGMTTGTQPVFIHDFGDLYTAVLGEERSMNSYPMNTWVNAGLKPVASTDCPVCDINPFPNLYAMITRKTKKGTVMGGQERLTIDQALACYTENGAWASFAEREKGTLEPGKLADVAVLSRDLHNASPEEILHDTACDLTIRGGRLVYDRMSEAA
jgi:predicted amidohydrolase YtcJ